MKLGAFYSLHLKPQLPPALQEAVHAAWVRYDLWLLRPLPTRIRGHRWQRSREIVTIDITYACDLRCFNCNRSCTQDPSDDHVTLGQVRRFLEESRERQIRWKRIRLMGGEPTLHPQFLELAGMVLDYRDRFSPETEIVVVTNGYSERGRRLIAQLPPTVEVMDSAKSSRVQTGFYTFNVAPIDVPRYAKADFSNACGNPCFCGMAVTPYGYYPCAMAGAIDRTFGFDLGRKTLPDDADEMRAEFRTFCALCGKFKGRSHEPLEGPVMSPTWVEAYEHARRDRPRLTRLPESAGPPDLDDRAPIDAEGGRVAGERQP